MSRKAPFAAGRPAPAAAPPMANGNAEDICPVCKTIRYLNKDMVMLINAECYHPMCSNCVARLFAGPNQCPYPGCPKTLRRKDFHGAFFEDLGVEREVDIRRRVASVFNKVEDDFETLDAYNAFLETVETLTMDLVAGAAGPRATAEARLAAYEAEHRAEIERNRRKGERADELTRRAVAQEREAARARRAEAAQADEAERRARALDREADLDALGLAQKGSATKVMLKRRGQHVRDDLAGAEESLLRRANGLTIRGLKERERPGRRGAASEGPYDPFGGVDLQPARYVEQKRSEWKCDWLNREAKRESIMVGGYNVQDYYSRAMFEMFSGMGVFVSDEKETGEGTTAANVATLGAALAAAEGGGKMEID